MSHPETELLDALDAVLAGDPVREGFEDVALLVTDVRAQAPPLRPELQTRIEEGLAGGFARRRRLLARLAGLWTPRRRWVLGPAAGVSVAAAAAIAVVLNVGDDPIAPTIREGDRGVAPSLGPAPERQTDPASPDGGRSSAADDAGVRDPSTGGTAAPDAAEGETAPGGSQDTAGSGESTGGAPSDSTGGDTPSGTGGPPTGDAPSGGTGPGTDTAEPDSQPDGSTSPPFTGPDEGGRAAPPPPPAPPATSPEAPPETLPQTGDPAPTAGAPAPQAPSRLTVTLAEVRLATRSDRGTETLSGLRISGACGGSGSGGELSIGRAAPYEPLRGATAPARRTLQASCDDGRFEVRRATLVVRLGSGPLTVRSGGRTFTVRVGS